MRSIKLLFVIFLMFLVAVPIGFSLKGSIGKARMYLEANVTPGIPTYIEDFIPVNNKNNVSVKITITPFDNFKNITTVIDNEFILQPGESKDAKFSIKITQPGQYEGKIGASFIPSEPGYKGTGVGLQSIIIINAHEKNSTKVSIPNNESDTPNISLKQVSKANPVIGFLIIIVLATIGIILYLLITKKIK